jgi:hypothetical protein
MRALRLAAGIEIAGKVRRGRRMVHHDHAGRDARFHGGEHFGHVRIVAEAEKDIFRAEGGRGRVFRHFALVLGGPVLGFRMGPVPHHDLMAFRGQMARHVKSHHSEAQKCRACHIDSPIAPVPDRSNFIEIPPSRVT